MAPVHSSIAQLTNDEIKQALQKRTEDVNEALYLAALYNELIRRFHAGEWD